MAYITSNTYKDLIYNENSEQILEISVNNQIVNPDYIRSVKHKDDVFEGDYFSLGSIIASKYELELDKEVLNDIDTFEEVSFKFILGEDTIPLGNYIVKNIDDSSSDYIKLTMYDYVDKLNVNFDASEVVPCTRYELLQAICEYCNIELYNESIINGDVIVDVYDNTLTAKQYISFISERAGGFAKVIRNKLKITSFGSVDEVELPSNIVGDYKTNELKTITKVVYDNGIQIYDAGTDDGVVIYLSQDSPFSCSQDEVDNIYDNINGLQFQTLDIRIWGDPSIDTGDKIILGDYKSFAQKDWSWGNGFYGSYKTILNEINQTSTTSKISSANKIKRLSSKIDEVEGTIDILSEKVDGNTSSIGELEITAETITSRVSATEQAIIDANGDISTLSGKVNNDYDELFAKFDNYAPNSKINEIQSSVTQLQTSTYTKTQIQQIANGTGVDGVAVSAVINTEGTFDKDGMHYEKTGAPSKSTINQYGLDVDKTSDNSELLYAGYDYDSQSSTYGSSIVRTDNLTVKTYLKCGGTGRIEN